LAQSLRSFAWSTGVFDTGRRTLTERVKGTIRTPHHLVMVTLKGRAERLEVASSCGHRYQGRDQSGAVSFVPAHCERRFQLHGVAAEWASIALSTALFEAAEQADGRAASLEGATFTNLEDPFVFGLVGEFTRLAALDGGLDPAYAETMAIALASYLTCRFGRPYARRTGNTSGLAPWHLRRITDHVEAHLAEPLRIAELAALVGLSSGFFHRSFRASTGKTPLAFINERRIQRAMQHLVRDQASVAAIALKVGFLSPAHFARTFQEMVGMNPSAYRSGLRR
jgi:AraC family transcriptional regulator